jgi:hypothetical protein
MSKPFRLTFQRAADAPFAIARRAFATAADATNYGARMLRLGKWTSYGITVGSPSSRARDASRARGRARGSHGRRGRKR